MDGKGHDFTFSFPLPTLIPSFTLLFSPLFFLISPSSHHTLPQMMAWLQLWTMGLVATMASSISFAIAEDSGPPAVDAGKLGPFGIVKKETHPVLIRQKRDWIWNNLYVEEEKPVPIAFKIGQVS